MTFIYTLEHPITGEIRYVGKTNNPYMRFHDHCKKSYRCKTHKDYWINKLLKEGLRPVMSVLDEVSKVEWKYWEKFWIEQCRQWGFKLVNHTNGGDGLTFANHTSFKKSHKPWNKGKSYKTGKSTPVLQYTKKGDFVKEHIDCNEASREFGCIQENIRRCCVGLSKSAVGFVWKYKTEENDIGSVGKNQEW